MIADSVGFCREQRQARRSSTPSTSSTATATTRPTRSNAPRRGRGRGRERHPLRHQRRQPAGLGRRGHRGRRRRARRGASRSASTPTTTPSARSPTRWPRSTPERGSCRARINGYGERCGNANLASILPALQLKMGFDVVSAEQLANLAPTAHYLDELCNLASDPDRALRRPQRLRPQGAGCTPPASRPTPRTFEHLDPTLVGNERDDPRPPSSPARRRSAARPSRPGSRSTTRPPRGRSSA